MKHFNRYFPLSEEAQASGLYTAAGGINFVRPGMPYPPVAHPADHAFRWSLGRTLSEYQLIYITRGGGSFESKAGGCLPVKAGDMFMLFPGEWHRYRPDPQTGWDEYWVAFNGHLVEEFLAEFPFCRSHPVHEALVEASLIKEFDAILQEIREERAEFQKVIIARLLHVLALAVALPKRRDCESSDSAQAILRAKEILKARASSSINAEEIAADIGMGYSRFRQLFREQTGMGPSQYHLQARINLAADLLRSTTLPISQISDRMGFNTPYYFARIFLRKTGYSPRAYRARSQTPSPMPFDDC